MRDLLVLLLLCLAHLANAQDFTTNNLANIAKKIGITEHTLDTFHGDSTREHTVLLNKDSIRIKTNELKEICHIGYKLFPNSIKDPKYAYLYDFVERYILELQVMTPRANVNRKLKQDKVKINGVFLKVLHDNNVDSIESLSINEVENYSYELSWTKGDSKASIIFQPNCQLILGSDDKELDEIAKRSFERIVGDYVKDYSLIIDKYGFKRDTIPCNRADIFMYVEEEGCQIIIKPSGKDYDSLYAINRKLNYIHLIMLKEKEAIMYSFIPIHIAPDYFLNLITCQDNE